MTLMLSILYSDDDDYNVQSFYEKKKKGRQDGKILLFLKGKTRGRVYPITGSPTKNNFSFVCNVTMKANDFSFYWLNPLLYSHNLLH